MSFRDHLCFSQREKVAVFRYMGMGTNFGVCDDAVTMTFDRHQLLCSN